MCKKIIWTGLLAGVFMIIASFGLNFIFNWIFPHFMDVYTDTSIFRAASDPLMMLFWAYPLVLGLVLAWGWSHSKKLFRGKSVFKRGLKFGLAYAIIYGIPMLFVNISSFNIPIMMVVTWAIMGLVNGFLAGWTFAKFNK